jgi:hypothetical protein
MKSLKSDKSTDRGVEKWFPGMIPKALGTLAEMCYCLKENFERNIV